MCSLIFLTVIWYRFACCRWNRTANNDFCVFVCVTVARGYSTKNMLDRKGNHFMPINNIGHQSNQQGHQHEHFPENFFIYSSFEESRTYRNILFCVIIYITAKLFRWPNEKFLMKVGIWIYEWEMYVGMYAWKMAFIMHQVKGLSVENCEVDMATVIAAGA